MSTILYKDGWNIKFDTSTPEYIIDIAAKILTKLTYWEFKLNDQSSVVLSCIKTEDSLLYKYEIKEDEIVLYYENKRHLKEVLYLFFEEECGVKYLTAEDTFFPKNGELILDNKIYEKKPKIEYRNVYYDVFKDEEFAIKHRVETSREEVENWLFWSHSFQYLLPKEVFETNPEYFALIDGERREYGQPCLMNKDVRAHIIENIKDHLKGKEDVKYIAVSQNDDANYCRCDLCKARDAVDEAQMGSILDFINEVADTFPDYQIATLAYWYSRTAPKVTKPRDNVKIMLCNIEAKLDIPIREHKMAHYTRNEVQEWKKITNNILLWDYHIQFRNLVSPFPNLDVIFDNTKYYVENGVNAFFHQANREVGGEMHELRAYLLAKSLWDFEGDWYKYYVEFCEAFYLDAAPFIIEYIDKLHAYKLKHNQILDIFDGPYTYRNSFLRIPYMKEYNELFEEAYYAVGKTNKTLRTIENDEYNVKLKQRIESLELALLYAKITNRFGSSSSQLQDIARFAQISKKNNVAKIEEWDLTTNDFLINSMLNVETEYESL